MKEGKNKNNREYAQEAYTFILFLLIIICYVMLLKFPISQKKKKLKYRKTWKICCFFLIIIMSKDLIKHVTSTPAFLLICSCYKI